MEKEQIINSIFNRRAIWNQSHLDHRNRYVLDRLWTEVAEECQSTVKVVQAKWKNLRDYYRNEFKKIPMPQSGDAADITGKSHWPYFKNLMFLKDQILPRQSQSNLPEDVITETDNSNFEQNEPSNRSQSQLSDDEDHTELDQSRESVDQSLLPTPSSSTTEEPRTILPGRSRKRTHHMDTLISIEKEKMKFLINKQANKKAEVTPADEDKLFFESILPHVKKIQDCDKLQFRNEIQILVQKYAYNPLPSPPAPPAKTFQIINPDNTATLFSEYQ